MPIGPYEPTPEDLEWMRQTLRVVRHGATVTMPKAGMVYQADKVNEVFKLTFPNWDATPFTMLYHHHNDYICRAIGWTISPAINWEEL